MPLETAAVQLLGALLQKQRLTDEIQINTYFCTFRKKLNCFVI